MLTPHDGKHFLSCINIPYRKHFLFNHIGSTSFFTINIIITIKYKLTIRYFSSSSKQTPLTFDSTDTVANFSPDAHPLKVFLSGDHDAQLSIILDHSQVEGFLFLKHHEIHIAYFTKKIVTYDNKGKSNTIIAATIGDSEDYNIFSIEDHYISADTYHFADSTALKDISASVPIKTFFDALPLTPTPTTPYHVLTDKNTVVVLPLIFPKLKEVEIQEVKITDNEVRDSFLTYHPLLL